MRYSVVGTRTIAEMLLTSAGYFSWENLVKSFAQIKRAERFSRLQPNSNYCQGDRFLGIITTEKQFRRWRVVIFSVVTGSDLQTTCYNLLPKL